MCWSAEKPQKKLSDSTNSSTNTELNPLKVCCFFLGGESNESVMVLHHTPKIYELIHEGSVSTVTLNQLISMRWCQSPSSIWLELIDQANILLVQCPAFNECYLLHWWRGGKEQKPSLVVISSNVTDGGLSLSQLGVCLSEKTKTFGLCGQLQIPV